MTIVGGVVQANGYGANHRVIYRTFFMARCQDIDRSGDLTILPRTRGSPK